MIRVLIGTAGGVGTSAIARDFAREKDGALLIEASNRMRVQDLFVEGADSHIYDYYDWISGRIESEKIPFRHEAYDLIQGNPFQDAEDVAESDFAAAVAALAYEEIVVDLSRYRDVDLLRWIQAADVVHPVLRADAVSERGLDRIRLLLMRHRIDADIRPIYNRLLPGEREKIDVDKWAEDAVLYFEESENVRFTTEETAPAAKEEKTAGRFWDIFRPKRQ